MPSENTILVVGDDPDLCYTLALILSRAGYLVTATVRAHEALQYLQTDVYDLIFLDLKTPDIDGLALLREIRRSCPETPVLVLTTYATPESTVELMRQGARDCLSKPIGPVHILARVHDILLES